MTPARAYERADRAVAHWQRILAGSLSPAQRHEARLLLIRAVGERAKARAVLERIEYREVVGEAA
jgi:hypothetical protein